MSSPSPEPDRLLTSANNSTLAELKRDWLDPRLRELGLDPDRYELAYELLPAGGGFPRPVESEVRESVSRVIAEEVLQKIATALAIPLEILRATPTDPYRIGAFERTRRRFIPRWRYVSGGKALHAFIGDSDRPACGIDPRRGRDRHPARWMDGDPNRRSPWRSGPHIEHGPCSRAVQEHQRAMLQRPEVSR